MGGLCGVCTYHRFFLGLFRQKHRMVARAGFYRLKRQLWPGQRRLTFRGTGGTGAKDGFLFALELAPSVILSLGIIAVTEGLGGLRAAQQLMTPILRPLLGVPGVCSWR
jgi:hypothetical protein